eukprot:TRINITY_DN24739_c0_g1_i2.p1 TRINITY_DN24739_c0_g1~~TRINITY_DN24739_c0_g1_i2.p1  ORF type:complete len:187 (+),score=24.84 TRINITY_DN24739_c0_g1_i2:206-766(+)
MAAEGHDFRDGDTMTAQMAARGAALGSCSQARQWGWAVRLLAEARQGRAADLLAYGAVLGSLEGDHRSTTGWLVASGLFTALLAEGLRPGPADYGVAIGVLAAAGEWSVAAELLERLPLPQAGMHAGSSSLQLEFGACLTSAACEAAASSGVAAVSAARFLEETASSISLALKMRCVWCVRSRAFD